MNYLGQNLKYLRKKKLFTQEQCAKKLGLKRTVIGAYEEGRIEPKINTLLTICNYFNVSLDDFLRTDLKYKTPVKFDSIGSRLRVLPIVTVAEKELCTIVDKKASAGYTSGLNDIDFVEKLPKFNLPFPELTSDKTHRIFQIQGESMLPIRSGAYVICEYLHNWTDLKSGQSHVIITANEGVVYKRVEVLANKTSLLLISDNTQFQSYEISLAEVLEIWIAKGTVDFQLPDPKEYLMNSYEVSNQLHQIQTDLIALKKKL